MSNSIEVSTAANGFTLTVYKEQKGHVYNEPERFVAKDKAEAIEILTKWFD